MAKVDINLTKYNILLLIGYPIIITVIATFCDVILYQKLVVPRLPEVQAIPLLWWLGIFCPVFFSCWIIGAITTRYLDVLTTAFPTAILYKMYGHAAAILHQPGHLKSLAIEDTFTYWTLGLIASYLLFLFLLSIGWACKKKIRFKIVKPTHRI